MSKEILAAGNDIEDRPNLGESPDFRVPDPEHGGPDHLGVYCGYCALLSGVQVQAAPTGGDHWQNLQLRWQEECDIVFRAFDDAVADHFPDHEPVNCDTCPSPPNLPEKPVRPIERAIAQSARDE